MAIEKYTTESFVIESFDQGEHDRVYKLFTRDFGLVMAHAKSVRRLESKLRAHLLPRTRTLVTLVQGRDVWRLVGAEERKASGDLHDVAALIRRFIKGEGAHSSLFDRLVEYGAHEASWDQAKARLLLYVIFLTELGYADARVLGAKNAKEYASWSVEDVYVHLLLSYKETKAHVHEVLKEMQL